MGENVFYSISEVPYVVGDVGVFDEIYLAVVNELQVLRRQAEPAAKLTLEEVVQSSGGREECLPYLGSPVPTLATMPRWLTVEFPIELINHSGYVAWCFPASDMLRWSASGRTGEVKQYLEWLAGELLPPGVRPTLECRHHQAFKAFLDVGAHVVKHPQGISSAAFFQLHRLLTQLRTVCAIGRDDRHLVIDFPSDSPAPSRDGHRPFLGMEIGYAMHTAAAEVEESDPETASRLRAMSAWYPDPDNVLDITLPDGRRGALGQMYWYGGSLVEHEKAAAIGSVYLDHYGAETRSDGDPRALPYRLHPVMDEDLSISDSLYMLVSDSHEIVAEFWEY